MHHMLTVLPCSLPALASAQPHSLARLKLEITRAVRKDVALVKPADYFIADAKYILNGYSPDDDAEFWRRLDEVAAGETPERKAQVVAITPG